MEKNHSQQKTTKALNDLVTAYKTNNIFLFESNLPVFKKEMILKLKKQLTDQDCVILIRNIVHNLPN